MEPLYSAIKTTHIAAVLVSGGLFAARAIAANVFGATWTMRPALRYASYATDTVLLVAALMLTTIIRQYPFVNAWLTVKVLLLVVYIVLGSFALKRGRGRGARIAFSVAAIAVFLFILSVARSHDPLGMFATR